MSSWIKANFRFDERYACFVVTRVDAIDFNADRVNNDYAVICDTIIRANNESAIDEVERMVLAMVEKHRPELRGALLHAVSYEPAMAAWKLTLSHPSLPKVKAGAMPRTTRLVKKEGVEYVEFDEPTMVT